MHFTDAEMDEADAKVDEEMDEQDEQDATVIVATVTLQ
jgi:hypothetical protein